MTAASSTGCRYPWIAAHQRRHAVDQFAAVGQPAAGCPAADATSSGSARAGHRRVRVPDVRPVEREQTSATITPRLSVDRPDQARHPGRSGRCRAGSGSRPRRTSRFASSAPTMPPTPMTGSAPAGLPVRRTRPPPGPARPAAARTGRRPAGRAPVVAGADAVRGQRRVRRDQAGHAVVEAHLDQLGDRAVGQVRGDLDQHRLSGRPRSSSRSAPSSAPSCAGVLQACAGPGVFGELTLTAK